MEECPRVARENSCIGGERGIDKVSGTGNPDFFHVLLQVAKRLMLGYQLYAPKLLVGE
jgi:hypothetical protein